MVAGEGRKRLEVEKVVNSWRGEPLEIKYKKKKKGWTG